VADLRVPVGGGESKRAIGGNGRNGFSAREALFVSFVF
jgi:hypothetical protein